jgi:TonB family protein
MLRILVASQPVKTGWLGSTVFSTVTHGALIALAVAATRITGTSVQERRASQPVERVNYIQPLRFLDALRPRAAAPAAQSEAKPAVKKAEAALMPSIDLAAVQQIVDAAAKVPDLSTAADLTAVTDAWLAQPDGMEPPSTSLASLLAKKTGFVAPANGIYTADLVDRSVEPKRGNPKPRYPSQLADLGIEGTFVVRFVVDSTGIVPEDKIEFPATMHRLFMSAVRVALLKSRYTPAMAGGHVVPQEVIQEFRFQVNRR